jgi:hypothetical protein
MDPVAPTRLAILRRPDGLFALVARIADGRRARTKARLYAQHWPQDAAVRRWLDTLLR